MKTVLRERLKYVTCSLQTRLNRWNAQRGTAKRNECNTAESLINKVCWSSWLDAVYAETVSIIEIRLHSKSLSFAKKCTEDTLTDRLVTIRHYDLSIEILLFEESGTISSCIPYYRAGAIRSKESFFCLLTHWRKLWLFCLSLTQSIEPMRWFIHSTSDRQSATKETKSFILIVWRHRDNTVQQ